jgi:HEPN domain-containing protein
MGEYYMNKIAATEWLEKAWHHFSSGKVLYEVKHYTDTIRVDLHYGVEIMLKAFLAYENKKMIKTHDLIKLYPHIKEWIEFSDKELELLEQISTYHIEASYPSFDRRMPTYGELEKVIEFSEKLFGKICKILDIDENEVKK